VRYDAAGKGIARLIRQTRPEAVVMLGLATNRRKIGLEAVALNVDHCESGSQRRWRRPIGKGPLALPATLPLDRLYRRLRRARIPVALSFHAGSFICNHVFYVALARSKVPCGFVHVPPASRLPLRRQMRAVSLILEELARPTSARPR
jgi:pyroglutamyl-peptidase